MHSVRASIWWRLCEVTMTKRPNVMVYRMTASFSLRLRLGRAGGTHAKQLPLQSRVKFGTAASGASSLVAANLKSSAGLHVCHVGRVAHRALQGHNSRRG